MPPGRRALTLALVALVLIPLLLAGKKPAAISGGDQRKRVIHALNRLTFGPCSGEVERVMTVGLDRWIDAQLHPDSVDDHPLEARLASFRTLHMSTAQLREE